MFDLLFRVAHCGPFVAQSEMFGLPQCLSQWLFVQMVQQCEQEHVSVVQE